MSMYGGAWVAQSVEHLTLGFNSGHDVTVHKFEPHVRLHADSAEAAWDSVSLSLSSSLCPSPTCAVSVSLKINKQTLKKRMLKK